MNKKKTEQPTKTTPNPKWIEIDDQMLDQVPGGIHKNRPQI